MIRCWGWTTPLSAEMFIWGLPSACWDQGELWKSKSNPVAGTQKEGAAWDFQWILHGIPHRILNGFPMDWSPYDFRQAQLGDTTLRLDAETQRRKDLEVRALRGAGDDEGLMRGWCLMVDDWGLWFWVTNMFYIFIVPGSPATASRHYQRFGSKARLCYWSAWKRWSLAPRKTKLIVCRLCSVLRFLVFLVLEFGCQTGFFHICAQQGAIASGAAANWTTHRGDQDVPRWAALYQGSLWP